MERDEVRRTAQRGLVPTVLTVAVIAGGAVGGRAGGGATAVLVAAATGALVLLVLGGLAVALLRPAAGLRPATRPGEVDLAARWAEVEPLWSGRR